MGKKGFYFDMASCIGCRTCQVACKDKNNLKVGTLYRQVRSFESGKFPKPGFYHYSYTCNHCSNPKCVEACPTGAMYIAEDKTVQHDDSKCIGCKYCTWACPYGIPQYIPDLDKVGKCDMCKDLTDKGENPVCVDACPMRCIEWGDLDELRAKHKDQRLVSDIAILPSSKITTPSLLINPKLAAYEPNCKQKEV